MSLTFGDVAGYLTTALEATDITPTPPVLPGPAGNSNQYRKNPQAIVFVAVGGGAAMTVEQLYEPVFLTVNVIGRQLDYDGAEALALTVDKILCNVVAPRSLGATRVLYVNRTGGRPQLYQQDDGDRFWFSCTYICEASRADAVV